MNEHLAPFAHRCTSNLRQLEGTDAADVRPNERLAQDAAGSDTVQSQTS